MNCSASLVRMHAAGGHCDVIEWMAAPVPVDFICLRVRGRHASNRCIPTRTKESTSFDTSKHENVYSPQHDL